MGGKTVREERLYNHMIKILGLGPPLIHLHQQQFITEYLNISVQYFADREKDNSS